MSENHPALRIIFAGTPEFAAASLQALLDHADSRHYDIVAVYTQPDRPAGRGQKCLASPVKNLALSHNIAVYQPENFKQAEDRTALAELQADLMIVAAYGLILPTEVLTTPKLGCLNVHASLLPRWRGAAPIHRAIIAGDRTTGITIMQMDEGLDTGAMLLKAECPIESTHTSGQLHDVLAKLGGETLLVALEKLQDQQLVAEVQNHEESTYAAKLLKQEGQIDWQLAASTLERKVRGLSPWPVAYTTTQQGIMRIHSAEWLNEETQSAAGCILKVTKEAIHIATGEGILAITSLQFAGGKRLSVKDALNGKHGSTFQVGQLLGEH